MQRQTRTLDQTPGLDACGHPIAAKKGGCPLCRSVSLVANNPGPEPKTLPATQCTNTQHRRVSLLLAFQGKSCDCPIERQRLKTLSLTL